MTDLRIVRGEPTAEELAVVAAVVSAVGGDGDDVPTARLRGGWNDPAMLVRRALQPGPGAWRAVAR